MSNASTQVARLMALTPYLRARPDGVPLRDLATTFEVGPDQMRKDLQTLVMCGLPELLPDDLIDIDLEAFEDDPEGIVRINNADFMPRPTRLRSGEAASLLVALAHMADDGDAETRALVEQVRAKIELATQEGATGKVTVLPSRPSASQEELKRTIDDAVRRDRQVRLTHLNTTRDEISERVVDPVGLVRDDGKVYLDAWCHRSGGRRLFRIDRIQSLDLLDTPREHTDLPAREDAAIFEAAPDDIVARLRLRPGARWIAAYRPVLSSEEAPDGCLDITLQVSDPRWLVRMVLGSAPDVEVLDPPDLAAQTSAAAAAALAAYDVNQ